MADSADIVPKPGSAEAVARGCICPVHDNFHGEGVPYGAGRSFWIVGGCPVHWPPTPHQIRPTP